MTALVETSALRETLRVAWIRLLASVRGSWTLTRKLVEGQTVREDHAARLRAFLRHQAALDRALCQLRNEMEAAAEGRVVDHRDGVEASLTAEAA